MKKKLPKIIIKDTGKYGKGVFAGEDIKEGQVIYILDGEKMDLMELVEKINTDKEDIDDPLQVGRRTYIDLDKISRTFNHSCNPTTGIRKRSEMFALRDITKNEEITYDYSSIIAPTKFKMKCGCGAKKCRKMVGDILSLSNEQLDYYKRRGALQKYMKTLLKEVESGKYKIPKYELKALEMAKKIDNVSKK